MKDQALYDLLGMLPVEPGSFMMGSPFDERGRMSDEVRSKVTLTRRFELGKFPVTNLVWTLAVDEPLEVEPFLPKINVSWDEAVQFCQALNDKLGLPQAMIRNESGSWRINLDSPGFRLPTEAEWEYACRAGTIGPRYGPIDDIACSHKTSERKPCPVGLKVPNDWGFHDMLGNVGEWCWNLYSSYCLGVIDPTGSDDVPVRADHRVVRGNSQRSIDVRAASREFEHRNKGTRFIGFRLARTL
jgi:formylglycine-generating enzyme required for sulfatase activity